MKRRTFILSAAAATVAVVTIPIVKYKCGNTITHNPLVRPDTLAHFCDEKTIREIGLRYRVLLPSENAKKKLTKILLTDNAGKKIKASDYLAIADLIKEKIKEEFLAGETIVVNGWIISSTEARQCALYSLT